MSKKLLKDILLIVTYCILLVVLIVKLDSVAGVIGKLFNLLSPLFIGFGIAFVLDRPTEFFYRLYARRAGKNTASRKKKGLRYLAIATTYLLLAGAVTGVVAFIIPQLSKSIATLVGYMGRMQEMVDWVTDFLQMEPIDLSNIKELMQKFIDNPVEVASGVFPYLINFTSNMITFVTNFCVSFVVSVYLLADKVHLLGQCRKLIHAVLPLKTAERCSSVTAIVSNTFSRFITGQCTESIILGVLCFIGMVIFRFEYALLISVIIGVTSLIPILGAFIGCIPSVFILLMTEKPISAVWFVIFIIVLQQLEGNLIYPKVVGSSIGLPSLWVLLAVLVGGGMFGIAGMLLGVPAASVIYQLIGMFTNRRLGHMEQAAARGEDTYTGTLLSRIKRKAGDGEDKKTLP